jgi:hypothetical protein
MDNLIEWMLTMDGTTLGFGQQMHDTISFPAGMRLLTSEVLFGVPE